MTSPAATVGILGGGQLGRMLALAGLPLGIRCVALEPSPNAPIGVAAEVIAADYDDQSALDELARRCDVVTIEVEHVPVSSLAWLAERLPVRPSPEVVAIGQDRLLEKRRFTSLGIGTAPFALTGELPDDLPKAFAAGTIVKRRTGGFDGRGQVWLPSETSADDVVAAATSLGAECVAEGVVAFDRELSIVAARGTDGTVVAYPLVENSHREGILRETVAPAPGPAIDELQRDAEAMVTTLLDDLDHVGVFALELFEVDGRLLANEFAPRVHNSGHWTIEGSTTSQFEQHLRAVLGLALGDVTTVAPSAMVNLIGVEPDRVGVLALPGAHLHWYDKAVRPARKVGHVTVIGQDERQRDERLSQVRGLLADGCVSAWG